MYWAVILLCAAGTPVDDCTQKTAVEVIQGPASPGNVGCLMQGQFFMAGFLERRQLPEGEVPKIICEWRGSK